jgi:hypothetical protein
MFQMQVVSVDFKIAFTAAGIEEGFAETCSVPVLEMDLLLNGSELDDNFVSSHRFLHFESEFLFDFEKVKVDIVDFLLDFGNFFANIFLNIFFL